MAAVNRKYRDRLFHFLFGKEERKQWTLELYNAINGSDYSDPGSVQITTIEDVLYLGMKNDVSFLIDNVMNLYEQQSTFNPNMPLRNLQYLGSLYEKYIEDRQKNKYSRTLISLPVPKFVVFFNGPEDMEDERILRLSDAFPPGAKADIEVWTRMLNINYGHNRLLLERCRPLREYAWLTDRIRTYQQSGSLEEAIDRAIRKMPDDFLIKPLLRIQQAEVKGMLLTEYDEEKQRALDRKDGFEEGLEKGISIGRTEGIEEGLEKGIDIGRTEGIEVGINIGRTKGIEKGIMELIAAMRELNQDEQMIRSRIIERFDISEEEADQYLRGEITEELQNSV